MEYEFLCKTFRCCIDEDCCNCPLFDFEIEHCEKQIKQQAFAFIIRQQADKERLEIELQKAKAEIEKLNIDLDAMRCAANSFKMHYDEAKSEAVWDIATEYEAYKEAVEVALVEARAEAIKEFAERLKDIYAAHDGLQMTIDNLVREMTEEKK